MTLILFLCDRLQYNLLFPQEPVNDDTFFHKVVFSFPMYVGVGNLKGFHLPLSSQWFSNVV